MSEVIIFEDDPEDETKAVAVIPRDAGLPVTRDQLARLEAAMLTMEQVECPVKHTFAPGAYAREIFLPANAVVVGKIHKHSHLNIVSRGIATVKTEFGNVLIDASEHPVTFASTAGTKRAVYCHTDVVWTTIHLTDELNLEKIESEIIAKNYKELDLFLETDDKTLLTQDRDKG